LTLSRPEDHLSFTFDRNIVYWDEGTLWGGRHSAGDSSLPECVESSEARERHPEKTCRHIHLDNNLYFDARGSQVLFSGLSLHDWQGVGYDLHSVAADPIFINSSIYHFALHPDSPALKRGFQPIDLSTVGPRPDRLKHLRNERATIH